MSTKRIVDELEISVTYTVNLSEVEIPEDIYQELLESYEEGEFINEDISSHSKTADWVKANILMEDRYEWIANVRDIE